ncbi:cytochrome C [Hyalangium minutum]|uniref:cytochrome C n=1 Tax=Hyalangium minutum TaxID=394096 RepID=UPI0004E72CE9|nr:cytochrome C [Hyalangium minutum]
MRKSTAPLAMKVETTRQVGSLGVVLLLASLTPLMAACGAEPAGASAPSELSTQSQAVEDADDERRSDPSTDKAVSLALEVEDGEGIPLRVKAGQTFFINQIDLRSSVTATRDEGVDGLRRNGLFAGLGWLGVRQVDEEFELSPGPEGYKRRRFYRNALWMDLPSIFIVEQVDAQGRTLGRPLELNAGANDQRRDDDDFFVRRFRAIQWTYDCRSLESCAGANNFMEEALVELRNARTPCKEKLLKLDSRTKALRLRWSLRPSAPYTIPVEQVARPAYDYGFSIDMVPVTPPRADGTYAPGTSITFRLTLKDGSGRRLHPQGSLPTYNEVVFGNNEPGIQYYRAFFDPSATYYRRKHRERMLMTQIIGPAQRIQPIRSILDLNDFLGPTVQTPATFERDGLFSQVQTIPKGPNLFGGAFDPTHAGWAAPVSDTWTTQLPANAVPGTYLVTVKGRRVYLGEDMPYSRTLEIQVGTRQQTTPVPTTGPCNSCHSKGGELASVLHGNDNRAACNGCHAPLSFELEGPIFVRVHFIHSRSDRFDTNLAQCSSCHLNRSSIQRTSKAACFSCHKTWSPQHQAQFGPLKSMYVGGGSESFQQCTSTCHTNHPQSGL